MSRDDYLRQFYERRRRARKMRARGLSFSKIGKQLGISRQRAWQLLHSQAKGDHDART